MTDEEFLAMLTRHEGKRNQAYTDSRGYLTIGIGFLIDPRVKGSGLTDDEIEAVLRLRVDKVIAKIDSGPLKWWRQMSTNRQAVLADMAFNLGEVGLENFKNTLAHMKAGNYNQAALDMLQSKWASQVGGRAKELSDMMRNG